MKRVLKLFGLTLLGLLLLASLWVASQWPALSAFPALPGAYEAKELCSCLFVEGRDQPACEAFIRQTVVPIDRREIDLPGRAVTVTALWTTRSARYIGPRDGCVLDPD